MTSPVLLISFWLFLTTFYLKKTENLTMTLTWQLGLVLVGFVALSFWLRKRNLQIIKKNESYSTIWLRTILWSLLIWLIVLSSAPALLHSLHIYHLFYLLSLTPLLQLTFLSAQKKEEASGAFAHLMDFLSLVTPALIIQLCFRVSALNPFFKLNEQTIQTLSGLVFIYSVGILVLQNLKKTLPYFQLKNWIPGFQVSYLGFLIFYLVTNNG